MVYAALLSMTKPASRSFAVLPADWSKLLVGTSEPGGLLAPSHTCVGRAVPREVPDSSSNGRHKDGGRSSFKRCITRFGA